MSVDPNEIWKKFDFFVRGRLKHVPEDFKYANLEGYIPEKRSNIIFLTLEMLVELEKKMLLWNLINDWHLFIREENEQT